jgi:hypothetical protein
MERPSDRLALGVDHKAVGAARARLQGNGEIPQSGKRKEIRPGKAPRENGEGPEQRQKPHPRPGGYSHSPARELLLGGRPVTCSRASASRRFRSLAAAVRPLRAVAAGELGGVPR